MLVSVNSHLSIFIHLLSKSLLPAWHDQKIYKDGSNYLHNEFICSAQLVTLLLWSRYEVNGVLLLSTEHTIIPSCCDRSLFLGSKTMPEHSKAIPEYSKTMLGHSKTIPEHSKAMPEQHGPPSCSTSLVIWGWLALGVDKWISDPDVMGLIQHHCQPTALYIRCMSVYLKNVIMLDNCMCVIND